MEAKEALDNVKKAITEKQEELKKVATEKEQLEKDIIYLSGQLSILEAIQPKEDNDGNK